MKKIIFVLIALVGFPGVSYAGKGTGGSGGKTDLQTMITDETAARQSADAYLQGQINEEKTVRQSADENIQSQVDQINAKVTALPSQLYAVVKTTILPPGWITNMIIECAAGDTLVGGMCRYNIDPEANGSTVFYDGPVIDSSYESWNCQVLNKKDGIDGTEQLIVYTTSICMKNNQ